MSVFVKSLNEFPKYLEEEIEELYWEQLKEVINEAQIYRKGQS